MSGLVVISMTAESESHRSAGIGGVRVNAIRVTLVHHRSFVGLAGTRRIDLVVLCFGCGRRPIGNGSRPAYSGRNKQMNVEFRLVLMGISTSIVYFLLDVSRGTCIIRRQ